MIKRGVAKRTPTSEILNSVGKRYSISPETARWYLKSMTNGKKSVKTPGKAASRGAAKRGRPKGSRNKRASASAPAILRKAGSPALVRKAKASARNRAREAAMLEKLLPEYARVSSNQAKLHSRLQEVRQLERTVLGSLRQAEKRAKKLETQLRGLI